MATLLTSLPCSELALADYLDFTRPISMFYILPGPYSSLGPIPGTKDFMNLEGKVFILQLPSQTSQGLFVSERQGTMTLLALAGA